MKILLIVLSVLACWCTCAFGALRVDVAENTLKVNGKSEEVFYYGFAAADWELASSGETIFKIDPLK